MKGFSTFLLSTLLGAGALAKNSKINQYGSLSDCQKDKNIIAHDSPALTHCETINAATNYVYLVVGDGAAGGRYGAVADYTCEHAIFHDDLQTGACIQLPDGTHSIWFHI